MKKQVFIAGIIVLLIGAQGCRSRQQQTTQRHDSTTAVAPESAAGPIPAPVTNRLTELGLTPDSHWRGTTLGDEFATIRQKEKGEPFESDAQHVGYTVEFANLESMDVLYYQQQGRVSAIAVDLYLNNRPSVDAYVNELGAYLTSRYGASRAGNGGSMVWQGKAGEQVTLTDVSKGKDFGLKLKFALANRTTT